MNAGSRRRAALLAIMILSRAFADPAGNEGAPMTPAVQQQAESSKRADKRYEEMLERMQSAVEEIAQMYGSPLFLEVFTNDSDRASALKQRLRSAGSAYEIQTELEELKKKREELLNDIALKEREGRARCPCKCG